LNIKNFHSAIPRSLQLAKGGAVFFALLHTQRSLQAKTVPTFQEASLNYSVH